MSAQLIVNADDFGWSSEVNAAVARAHREGILTSASLMVTGDAADEAVDIARELPGLAIGLHVTLTQSLPASMPETVPDLVGRNCRMPRNPIRAALACHLSRRVREQALSEIEAQFELFAATGLPLSHVDGHQHLHAHQAVLPTVIELALRYGARGIRIPRDPIWANLRVDRSRPGYDLLTAIGQAYLSWTGRRHVCTTSLATCDTVIGAFASGRMREDYVTRMLHDVRGGSVELYFHPMEVPRPLPNPSFDVAQDVPLEREGARVCPVEAIDPLGPNPGDLETLVSPSLRQFIVENGFRLTTYAGLRGRAPEAVRERA